MIEQRFKQDIEALLTHGKRAVVCDTHGDGAFLMNVLLQDIVVMTVHNEQEELEARYLPIYTEWLGGQCPATSRQSGCHSGGWIALGSGRNGS